MSHLCKTKHKFVIKTGHTSNKGKVDLLKQKSLFADLANSGALQSALVCVLEDSSMVKYF